MEACEGEGECVAVVAAGGGARMTTSMTRRWALALVMIAVAGCSRGEKKEVVVEEKGVPADRVSLIYPGIDLKEYEQPGAPAEIRGSAPSTR